MNTGCQSPQEDRACRFNQVRRQTPVPTPAWVNAIPDRLGDILMEKHHYPEGPVWGLARRVPEQDLTYDEIGSATFIGLVKQYELFDCVGPLTEDKRIEAIEFWQSWQDPKTGRFKDPRDPDRQVNEKYVVGLIRSLGGEPLYEWTTTGTSKKIETDVFLKRTQTDPDWQRGGWGVGSHTGFMAVEICRAVNVGQIELIPDLEEGMERILSHQDPASGLWGPSRTESMRRIGGTLKVIGRFYFALGMKVPYTRELADTLIDYQMTGKWFANGADSCVPRNVAEVIAYCLEASDYRRKDLLAALESLGEDYQHWVLPDGRLLMHRDDPNSVGLQYTTMYGLGIIGGYLNWEDCRLPNPLAGRKCGGELRYRPMLQHDGSVKVVDTGSTK
jgi:hypothetical protein